MVKKFQKPQNRPKELLIVQNSNKKTPKMGPNCQKLQLQNRPKLLSFGRNGQKQTKMSVQNGSNLFQIVQKHQQTIAQNSPKLYKLQK